MRAKELQDHLRENKIGLALFLNAEFERIEPNILYFSGYEGVGALVMPKEKKPFLIVPAMEYELAKQSKNPEVKVIARGKNKKLSEAIISALKKMKIKTKKIKIAVDKSFLTVNVHSALKKAFKGTKTADISDFCIKTRAIKTKEEISRIKTACRISDKILSGCIANFKKFKIESEAKAYLEHETKKLGCEIAFAPIVASGKNARMPHSDANDKIKKGFCVIDFGVRYKGYCSDTTRTIYIGKISEKEKQIYNFMLDTQKKLVGLAKPGIKCSEIYSEAIRMLGKYKKHFTHGLGHGIGIKVHELPNLTHGSKDVLKENMVFTVEPGIYLKNFGMRIEDTVLLGKKAEVLTRIPKDLLVIC